MALVLIFISVLLGAVGQLSWKVGMNKVGFTYGGVWNLIPQFFKILTTPFILLGLGCYGVATLLWLVILSRVDLSYAYPMISFAYVLVVIFSWLLLKEGIAGIRWLGVALICLGVFLVARS